MGILDYQKQYDEQNAMKKASQSANVVMPQSLNGAGQQKVGVANSQQTQPVQQKQPVQQTAPAQNAQPVSPLQPAPQPKTPTNFNDISKEGTQQQSFTPYVNNDGTYNYNAPANAFQKPQGLATEGVSTGAKEQLQSNADMQQRADNRNANAMQQQYLRNLQGQNGYTMNDVLHAQANAQNQATMQQLTPENIKKEGQKVATSAEKTWRDNITKQNSEAENRHNRTKLGILAIGDALRHMGNLYYTTKGATPQQFNSPVVDEYNRQEAEKKEKKAAELAQQQMKQKQEQQAIENGYKANADARANAELGLKQQANERENKKYEDESKKAAKQLEELDAKIAGTKSDALKKQYQADKERIVASLQGKLIQSQINAHNASAQASRASAANSAASRQKTLKEIGEMDSKNNITIYGDGENYTVSKNNYQSLGNNLRAIARKNGWFKNETEEHRATDKELLTAAYEHLNDTEVKDVLRQATGKNKYKY